MGPPLKRSTATISRRRRAASLRAASGTAAESWLMALKPPSVVSPSRSCTVPPPLLPRSNLLCSVRMECQVHHPLVCRYGNLARSIRSRSVPLVGPTWEVRVSALPVRSRAQPCPSVLSSLLTPGLGGTGGKVEDRPGSWLKTVARRLADASVDRRTPVGVASALVRRRCRMHPSVPVAPQSPGAQSRGGPFGLPQQSATGAGHRGEAGGGAERADPGGAADDQHQGHQGAAERAPAHDIAHWVG